MQLRLWITAASLAASALPLAAQYPGQVAQTNKDTLNLRAVAVLEWTGDEAKPKTSRLVPVCIYDGQALQDAGEYLARPAPIALESEVEYQLLKDGNPVGLFDVDRAGQQQGSWIAFGKWKPMPKPKAATQVAKIDQDDAQSDEPVLHRKHHGSDSAGASGNSSNSSGPDPNAPPPDPDRPTLHKSSDTPQSTSGDSGSTSSASAPANSPDSGNLKKKNEDDESYVSDVATLTDPNRPHLFRGKSAGYDVAVTPTLVGLPPDMHQEVAVSDPTDRPVHLWNYTWANPDDKARMKATMEDLARTALGLNVPPPKPAHKSGSMVHKAAQPTAPLEPAPLYDEQFRVFELAYSAGATMVLSAHTAGSGEQEKFVTLVAQPDLYGNIAILVKNMTDAGHLDETPRMRLVDAVDALADNRGELLFELRGATQRQFALYRVLRGDARRIFVTDPLILTVTVAN